MPELTRTEINEENLESREFIYHQDFVQVYEIKKTLDTHISLQKSDMKYINDKLDKLSPLVDLIPVVKSIVEKENSAKAVSSWAVRIGKTLGFIAIVIGSITTIAGAAWFMIETIIKAKQ